MQKITQEEIVEKINDTFDLLNQQRKDGLEKTREIQSIKNRQLKLEKERLIKKYGEDHPRVKKISSRLEYNKEMFKALDAEIENTKIETPDFTPNSWMVHGKVIYENGNGIQNLTVSLFDGNDNWIRELGYSCTDDRGYFSIIYSPEESKNRLSDDKELFLVVKDKENKVLHKEEEPLSVMIGQVDYREIIISEKKDTCNPPNIINEASSLTPDAWIVRGKVTDEKNDGIQGVTISLYDKDLFFDDVLGTTQTDKDGNYKLIYRTDAFRGLFEKKPDVYVKALDADGRKLFSSRKSIRFNAGKEEIINIKLTKRK